MNKIIALFYFIMVINNALAQNAVTISPSDPSASLRFNNSPNLSEKITFRNDGPISNMGIGSGVFSTQKNMYICGGTRGSISFTNFNSYFNLKPSLVIGMNLDEVAFGGGTTGYPLQLHETTRIQYSGSPTDLPGIWFDNAVQKNAFIGVDTSNNFIWAQNDAAGFGFYKNVSNGFLKMEPNGDMEISGSIANEPEQYPIYSGPWVNYGNNFKNGNYYKDKENMVHLSGAVKALNPENNILIFTLPIGYRPSYSQTFKVDAFGGSIATIFILPNGFVFYKSFTNNANNEFQYVSLSGISFRVN